VLVPTLTARLMRGPSTGLPTKAQPQETPLEVRKEQDFGQWYLEVIDRAGLVDKRYPIKGMKVWTAYGWKVVSLIDSHIRELLDASGHDEVNFPLLIPKTEFAKEAKHIAGFDDSVYWVTHAGTNLLDVPLLLRPTSETAMYPMFSLWVRSHTDLPLKTYQIVSTFRYETKQTRTFIRERRLSIYDQETGDGLLRFLMLREGKTKGEAMVNVVTASAHFPLARELAAALRERFPQIAAVVQNVNTQKAAVAVGQEEHLLAGRDTIQEIVAGLTFQISANSFFQTNTQQAERLFQLVLDLCELRGPETVFDLYSGTGAITLLLAQRARAIYGIEVGSPAIEDAVRNARANGIENVRFLQGEVRHVLPDLYRKGIRPDVVVADPPRAGLHPKAVGSLATLGPQRIVYVSCNPSTLARDLALLIERGYAVDVVQPIDMFPHTPHIEAAARLSRRG